MATAREGASEQSAAAAEPAAAVMPAAPSVTDLGLVGRGLDAGAAIRVQRAAGNRALSRAVSAAPHLLLAREPPPVSDYKNDAYTKANGEAFVQGAGDAADVDPNDVAQRQLGDCNLLAPLAAVAHADPAAIRKLITKKADGSFDVTLYYADHMWSDRTAHTINVTPTFYMTADNAPRYAQFGDVGPAGPELWPALIEKAFAKYRGGYDNAGGALWDREGLELLTGNTATEESVTAREEDDLLKEMSAALGRGEAVTVNTSTSRWTRFWTTDEEKKEIANYGIVMIHAYALMSVDTTKKTVNLRNPWGYQHLDNFPVHALRKYCLKWSRVKVK